MGSDIRVTTSLSQVLPALLLGLVLAGGVLVAQHRSSPAGESSAGANSEMIAGRASPPGLADPVTVADIPLPDGYRAVGPASLTDTSLTPTAAIAAAKGAHPSAVGDRPIVRFLLVERNDRAAPRPAQPMWVILSADVSNPLFGDVESLREGLPTFVASYGWVFLDAEGQALGATKISYSEPPPQLPDG